MALQDIQARNARGQIINSHINLPIGSIYGQLVVVGNERRYAKNYVVDCRCECGVIVECRVDALRVGKKLQCGAHKRPVTDKQRQTTSERNRTHGMSRTSEYSAWIGMKMRCYNPNDDRYADYGGRGITVHRDWESSFEAFLAHLGPKPSKLHSLDRINVDGNYEPGNVRWASASTQTKNRRPFLIRPGCRKSDPLPPPPAYIPPPQLPDGVHHNARHGMSGSPEYQAWRSMKKRCLDPLHPAYRNYGGRGITVHPDWINNFPEFLKAIGMRPAGRFSLDRISNERGYEPGNVRWADSATQNRNRRAFVIRSRNA